MVRPISLAEKRSPYFIKWAEAFDNDIIDKLGDPMIPDNEVLEDMKSLFDEDTYNYNVEALKETVETYKPDIQIQEYDEFTVDAMDKLLNDQV